MSKAPATLFFPVGMAEVADAVAAARVRGERAIGASSVAFEQDAGLCDSYHRLPYVFEEGFAADLAALVTAENIRRIVCYHNAAWTRLTELLPGLLPAVLLTPDHPPLGRVVTVQGAAWRRMTLDLAVAWGFGGDVGRAISKAQFDALAETALRLQGESNLAKMAAMTAIAAVAPAGDVVEIGTLYGRSAFVLGWLARWFELGPVLCVDPWQAAAARQDNAFLGGLAANWDCEPVFEGFKRNLAPHFSRSLNYVRASSMQVRADYRPGWAVETADFGVTAFGGQISLLHIDGNHNHDAVSADVEAWAPLLRPGGWLVLDDYVWPFGDGPRRVGDRLLAGSGPIRLTDAAVVGKALFARREA